jgi:hypothetical protein
MDRFPELKQKALLLTKQNPWPHTDDMDQDADDVKELATPP